MLDWNADDLNKLLGGLTGFLSLVVGPLLSKVIALNRSNKRQAEAHRKEAEMWAARCTDAVEELINAGSKLTRAADRYRHLVKEECPRDPRAPPRPDEPGDGGGAADAPDYAGD